MSHELQIIEKHLIIRETIGYDFFKTIEIENVLHVLDFLKIVNNYEKIHRLYKK